jgi:hypothetical protein
MVKQVKSIVLIGVFLVAGRSINANICTPDMTDNECYQAVVNYCQDRATAEDLNACIAQVYQDERPTSVSTVYVQEPYIYPYYGGWYGGRRWYGRHHWHGRRFNGGGVRFGGRGASVRFGGGRGGGFRFGGRGGFGGGRGGVRGRR